MAAWHNIGTGDGSITEIDQGYGTSLNPNPITTVGSVGLDLNVINERANCRLFLNIGIGMSVTYNNGSSGVGATLTNSGLFSALTVDSVTTAVGDRILVSNSSAQYQNGIYVVTNTGSVSTAWILTRTTDFDGSLSGGIAKGVRTWVTSGAANSNTLWIQTATGPFVIGTTPIVFTAYQGQDSITRVGPITIGAWQANAIGVPYGGTGNTSTTAYGVLCGGTTSTGAFQNAGAGTIGKVFVSNGPSSLPSFQKPSSVFDNISLLSNIPPSGDVEQILDTATNHDLYITTTGTGDIRLQPSGAVWLDNLTSLNFANNITANWVGFKSPSLPSAQITWTLPNSDSTGTQALVSDGAMNLSWSNFVTPTQTITLTGDVSGSGAINSSIATILSSSITRSGNQNFVFSSSGHGLILQVPFAGLGTSNGFIQIGQPGGSPPFTLASYYRHSYIYNDPTANADIYTFSYTSGLSTSVWSTVASDNSMTIYNGLHMNSSLIDNVSTFSIGRTKGTIGASLYEIFGTDSTVAGPHIQAITSADNYPVFQQLNWSHNNISLNFDSYYNGAWKSAYSNSNFQIYKINNQLQFNYSSGTAQGNTLSWSSALAINASGNIGIKTTSPNAPLQFDNSLVNRKIVLYEGSNNDHKFHGFGVNGGTLRYQITNIGDAHVWYVGTSISTSQELARISGNGDMIIQGTLYAKGPYGSMYFETNATTTTPASGVWTKLLGTTTAGLLNQFTMPTDNRLQYTGSTPINVEVYFDLSSIVSSSATRICGISLYKNGSRVVPSISYSSTNSLNYTYLFVSSAQFSMVQNDYIEMYVYANTSLTFTPSQMKVLVKTI